MPKQALDGGKVLTLIFSFDGHMPVFGKSILAFNLKSTGKIQNGAVNRPGRGGKSPEYINESKIEVITSIQMLLFAWNGIDEMSSGIQIRIHRYLHDENKNKTDMSETSIFIQSK